MHRLPLVQVLQFLGFAWVWFYVHWIYVWSSFLVRCPAAPSRMPRQARLPTWPLGLCTDGFTLALPSFAGCAGGLQQGAEEEQGQSSGGRRSSSSQQQQGGSEHAQEEMRVQAMTDRPMLDKPNHLTTCCSVPMPRTLPSSPLSPLLPIPYRRAECSTTWVPDMHPQSPLSLRVQE